MVYAFSFIYEAHRSGQPQVWARGSGLLVGHVTARALLVSNLMQAYRTNITSADICVLLSCISSALNWTLDQDVRTVRTCPINRNYECEHCAHTRAQALRTCSRTPGRRSRRRSVPAVQMRGRHHQPLDRPFFVLYFQRCLFFCHARIKSSTELLLLCWHRSYALLSPQQAAVAVHGNSA